MMTRKTHFIKHILFACTLTLISSGLCAGTLDFNVQDKNGKVIDVNVDNKKNRKAKKGRAVLIENGIYYVVGDEGIQRQLNSGL